MTISRARLVNTNVTRWYHCISMCVRQAFLLEQDEGLDRKKWLDDRLHFLNDLFAVSVAGYSVLDNHLHTLVRIDLDEAKRWPPEEVARRWFVLFPPRNSSQKTITVTSEVIDAKIREMGWVEKIRNRLSSISWFMKCLKEPLARLANKADGCKGAFFAGRFKSIAILDKESLLTVCAYIDLNPVAAGIAETPEESCHTSIKERVDHVARLRRIKDVQIVQQGSVSAIEAAAHLEEDLWLIPIEDRRGIDSQREGMVGGFTLGNYLMLVEYTGRIVRSGKVSISCEVADIFDRIGTTAHQWKNRIERMSCGRLSGSFMASSRELLRTTAKKLGFHHFANAWG